jgi:hypothetical protein
MAIPTAKEVRDLMDGYGIQTESIIKDSWIEARRDNMVIPWVERKTGVKTSGSLQVTEYYSGNGKDILILDHKPIISLDNIILVHGTDLYWKINPTSIEVINDDAVLKSKYSKEDTVLTSPMFPRGTKNIKVTYTYGYVTLPDDLKEAVMYLTAEMTLGFVANRTGGGALSVQQFSRQYGRRGKWSDIRDELSMYAFAILKKYMTGVVGG